MKTYSFLGISKDFSFTTGLSLCSLFPRLTFLASLLFLSSPFAAEYFLLELSNFFIFKLKSGLLGMMLLKSGGGCCIELFLSPLAVSGVLLPVLWSMNYRPEFMLTSTVIGLVPSLNSSSGAPILIIGSLAFGSGETSKGDFIESLVAVLSKVFSSEIFFLGLSFSIVC